MGSKFSSFLFVSSTVGKLRLVFYLVLAVGMMVLDYNYGLLWQVRYRAAVVVEPLYWLADLPARGVHALVLSFVGRNRLNEENQRLKEQLLLANVRINHMRSVAEQNRRLKELLDTSRRLKLRVQLARVISVDLGMYRHRLGLNVGTRQGVKVGQPVIDAHGVIGQITQVLPSISVMLLVTDPESAIPVVVERTGLRGVAYGSRDGGQLVLPNIPRSADIKPGDRLLTSGIGGRFPPGFPVGKVVSVAPLTTGAFLEVQADPSAALRRSRDVLLLHDLAVSMGPSASKTLPVRMTGRRVGGWQ